MRGKAEADRETDRSEQFLFTGKSEVRLNDSSTSIEDLKIVETLFFGNPDMTSVDTTNLQWACIKSDNFLIQSLKKMTHFMAHMIGKEAEQAEKDIKKAKRMFYGR